MSRARITENPFYVLGLRPDCSRAELEREGQKLLALLELGMTAAKTYPTPLGPAPRTADSVRQAMAELRDPRRRLLHELWATLPASPTGASASPAGAPASAPAAAPDQPGAAAGDPATAVPPGPWGATSGDPGPEPASGPPPPWPAAHAALGFGARR